MKKTRFLLATLSLLFVLCTATVTTSYAQPLDTASTFIVDSSTLSVSATLIEDHHLLILDCLEDMKSPLALSYGAQIAKGLTKQTVNGKTVAVYEPSKPITVTVTAGFVREVYVLMGAQQERFAGEVNNQIRDALFPQIAAHTWLVKQLQSVVGFNGGLKQMKIDRGFNTAKAFL